MNEEQREQIIEERIAARRDILEAMEPEDLFGAATWDALLDAEVERQLDAYEEELDDLSDEELMGNDYDASDKDEAHNE